MVKGGTRPVGLRRRLYISDVIIYMILIVTGIVALYPFLYVFSMSISSIDAVIKQKVSFYPVGFSLESFQYILKNNTFFTSYYNTIWYTVVGTTLNLLFTVLAAYPLSKKRFFGRNVFMFIVVFTMFFSGGMVPSYILINALGLINTRAVMVLTAACIPMYIIICRTFFQNIPDSIEEAAIIDGAGEFRIMTQIYIPLSKPVLAVLLLFFAVYHWNNFYTALIFLSKSDLMPLQIYLRRILIEASADILKGLPGSALERSSMAIQLKYSSIVVAILPIICVYPFLQKYFVQGIMIGSLKG